MSSSGLSTLTIEIIDLISTFVQPIDLRSLRLVCRELNTKTLHSFGQANFGTIESDLSRRSLQRLQKISESDHLATHVRCLRIRYDDNGKLGLGLHWRYHGAGHLREDSELAMMLRDIFPQKLSKCTSFHIHSYDEYKPTLDTFIRPSAAVCLVQHLISLAAIPVKSFTIESNHDGNGRLDTKQLGIPLSQDLSFIKAWAHVEELVLNYAMTSDQSDWVLQLICCATHLRKLSLRFYEHAGSASFIQNISTWHQLSRLEVLSLSSATMTEESIMALLRMNRDTLHSLSLAHITLEKGANWARIISDMHHQLPQLQHLLLFWLKQDVRDTIHHMGFTEMTKYPSVTGLKEDASTGRFRHDDHRIPSVSQPVRLRYWGRKKNVVGIEYEGKDMKIVLAALAETVEMLS